MIHEKLSFQAFKQRALKDQAFKAEYEALRLEFEALTESLEEKKESGVVSVKEYQS